MGDHRSAMIRFASNLARGLPIEVHRGSARGWLHVSDAVRAIEAAAYVEHYTSINIGHPHIVPMAELAEMIRTQLGADPGLIKTVGLPPKMTLIKRPTLERQRKLLGFEPRISIEEGVRRVCEYQRSLLAAESRSAAKAPPAPTSALRTTVLEPLQTIPSTNGTPLTDGTSRYQRNAAYHLSQAGHTCSRRKRRLNPAWMRARPRMPSPHRRARSAGTSSSRLWASARTSRNGAGGAPRSPSNARDASRWCFTHLHQTSWTGKRRRCAHHGCRPPPRCAWPSDAAGPRARARGSSWWAQPRWRRSASEPRHPLRRRSMRSRPSRSSTWPPLAWTSPCCSVRSSMSRSARDPSDRAIRARPRRPDHRGRQPPGCGRIRRLRRATLGGLRRATAA